MISGLEKIDPLIPDQVNQAVFLGDPPGPEAGGEMLEGFGLADALEWVAENRFDKIQDAQGGLALCFDPVAQVVPEFRLEYGAARPTPQGRPRLSVPGACRTRLRRPGRGARP